MAPPAIRIENLGKQYKLGLREEAQRSFGEALMHALASPWRRLRTLGEKSDGSDLFWALRDVSFDVEPGQVVGIIGRNGAGKSTLLKIASRVVWPTTGRATIRGRVGSLLEVGTGFHPELTGRENIYLNGAILGMRQTEIRAKFDEIVAFSEIERFLDTPVKRYSSGMYVRLAFAVAAHLQPDILIVDEVLAVGDVAFQQKCLGKMGDVAQGGRTVLFVSHNMRAVARLCNRAILLEEGAVAEDGDPDAVVARYLAGVRETDAVADPEMHFDERRDSRAQVTRVCLKDATNSPSLEHEVGAPLTVEIAFAVRENLDNLIAALQVCTTTGDILYVSTHVDEDNHWSERPRHVFPRAAGRYVVRAQIPGPLLNCGEYDLVARLFAPRGEVYDSVQGPRFHVNDMDSFASCLFQKPRRGFLALPIPWEVEYA